jgi:multidrug efflux system outer membrane protein
MKPHLSVVLLVVGVASGCSMAPGERTPVTVAAVPDSYAGADTASMTSDTQAVRREPLGWWKVYNDPVLDRLVDSALAANLDLWEAVARVEEVRQRYRIARADLYPQVNLNADASYTDAPANVGLGGIFGGGAGAAPSRFDYTTYTASLGFSYEIDFWGKIRNDTKAAISEFLASESDYRTARLSVIAATISTYLEVVERRRAVALTALNVDLLRERAELTDQRYYRGLVSSFELYTFRSLYRNAQTTLPVLESLLADAQNRLAVLLGRYAGSLDDMLGDTVPAIVLDPVPVDLPAALLEQRPDVMAAWQRMEAARYRIGARKADLFPAIRLNATAGLQSGQVGDLFRVDQYFLNLVGGLFQPIFQGGRLRANLSATEAQFQQRAAAYVRTVLTAYAEVATALANLENQKERYTSQERQLISARGSVDFQLRSLQRGVGSYIEYLDARSNLVSAESNMAQAERALAEARLALHRALGGSWVADDDFEETLRDEYDRLDDQFVPVGARDGSAAGSRDSADGATGGSR